MNLKRTLFLSVLTLSSGTSYADGFGHPKSLNSDNKTFTNPVTLKAGGIIYDTLSTPSPSPEAVALFRYLQDMSGKKMISGQMWVPWGIDELDYVKEVTGKYPAIRGIDYIHERDNEAETQYAMDWWNAGGIPTIMWHWGAPSIGEGYINSKKKIDIRKCFKEGTPEHRDMWAELKLKADHLQKLKDANVPILWRPFHELNGDWFWWGKQGPELFEQLWTTMYNYFVLERGLNNLIWVLCYTGEPDADWHPGAKYVDIVGADTYDGGSDPQLKMFKGVRDIIENRKSPIAYHECGTPPDPDESFKVGAKWSWWMGWHTTWLKKIDKDYLRKVYNHKLVITLDEVPNIVSVYGANRVMPFSESEPSNISAESKAGSTSVKGDEFEIKVGGADSCDTNDQER